MNKKAYREKFKDPRWQKKRLQIMERDKFMCQMCHATDETLNVHHKRYIWGNDPWDVPDDALITLCEGCHENESGLSDALAKLRAVVAERFSTDEVLFLAEMLEKRSDPALWGSDCFGPMPVERLVGKRRVKQFQSWSLISPKGLH